MHGDGASLASGPKHPSAQGKPRRRRHARRVEQHNTKSMKGKQLNRQTATSTRTFAEFPLNRFLCGEILFAPGVPFGLTGRDPSSLLSSRSSSWPVSSPSPHFPSCAVCERRNTTKRELKESPSENQCSKHGQRMPNKRYGASIGGGCGWAGGWRQRRRWFELGSCSCRNTGWCHEPLKFHPQHEQIPRMERALRWGGRWG